MYNCEKQILRVLNQITDEVEQYISEILIVDNRSSDKSTDVVDKVISSLKKHLSSSA